MMNQPLRRVDPLGRSTSLTNVPANWPWASTPTAGSVSPIRGGSERAIVDNKVAWLATALRTGSADDRVALVLAVDALVEFRQQPVMFDRDRGGVSFGDGDATSERARSFDDGAVVIGLTGLSFP